MSSNLIISAQSNEYALATGPSAVRRLHSLHNIYSPGGRRALLQAGLKEGMHVADFGCGVGVVTRMIAEIVGPSGSVTGIDLHGPQLEQARKFCSEAGLTNTSFVEASADNTGLPRNSFDLVYCRFLLLHLQNPGACLSEMREVLRPDGIVFVEDGDLASATSVPPTDLNAFAELFGLLAPIRGVDYSISNDLYHIVKRAGFSNVDIEIHQPAIARGEDRYLLQWSVAEAGPSFVKEGLITATQLERILSRMEEATRNPEVLVLMPRMSQVWGRKAA